MRSRVVTSPAAYSENLPLMTTSRTERITVKLWLACGCSRLREFDPGQDPQASKQRCRYHGKQTVERYKEMT